MKIRMTYIGAPTVLLEVNGVRLLTDPTFDPAGSQRTTGPVTLTKTQGPALQPDQVGSVDAVLLSHHHHFDNLDGAGTEFLSQASVVLTTAEGASELGRNAVGMAPGARKR